MSNEADEYADRQWVIYNDKLGVHDLVQIGDIQRSNGSRVAYLDAPYDMVGPFCFETLLKEESIKFAACKVMSQNLWRLKAQEIRREMFLRMQQRQEEFARKANQYTNKRHTFDEQNYREILGLPLDGVINLKEIKSAYKVLAKSSHPDSGGSHEAFCELQDAYEELLTLYQTR